MKVSVRNDHDEFLRATMGSMDLVYNLARRFSERPEDAEDLVQETYLAAYRAWRDRRRPRRVEPWMATICLNLGRSRYRTRGRRPIEVPIEDRDFRAPATRSGPRRRRWIGRPSTRRCGASPRSNEWRSRSLTS
jgi:RNA polymerase sigma factor (sigma-70 family)